ncbi:MAG TPA: efflux RND transporter periplasmic adaptor subunit [Firmicutes bacterium]|nr:efflux RND transporter periplasmic adaptor subunit [Bacillota bacterium]HOQ23612.1 efflux RND transporter periplasmic adaptor subunit [Bacillota bacterium]HPT68056.1 efflux RND transporter periplasmic adaptor subunit [Bacillota bacterium]
MRKPVMLISALVLLVAFAGYKVYVKISQNMALSREAQGEGMQRNTAIPMVKTYEVTPRSLTETLELVGTIQPETEVVLQPRVSGRLLSLTIEEGQYIQAGAVIGEIDAESLRIQLQQSLSTLAEVEASVQQAEVNASRLKLERDRYYELYQKKYVSASEYENANSAYLAAQAALEGVRAKQAAAAKNHELLQIQLRDTKITSPISGYVLKKYATAGANLTTGSTIATIVPLHRVKLAFWVEQAQAGRIRQGMPVQFTPDAGKNRVYHGTVGPINPTYNTETRTLELIAFLDNPGLELLPGMFGNTRIALGIKENVLAVPTVALISKEGQQGIYVVNATGLAEFRPVETGLSAQGYVEILAGLSPREQVIIVGQNRLRDGQPVEVFNEYKEGQANNNNNKSQAKGGVTP